METQIKPTDGQVIAMITQGNINAFEHLVRKYNERLFRIGMIYLKDEDMVEDAMQHAYINAYLSLKKFEEKSSFSTWITRIMINECLMILRNRKNENQKVSVSEALYQIEPTNVESTIIESEMKTTIEEAVLGLPEKYREVYMLREVEKLGVSETADILSISAQNVKVRLFRAKENVRTNILKTSKGVELFGYHLNRCDGLTARVMSAIKDL